MHRNPFYIFNIHAYTTNTLVGLASSLDDLLNATSPVNLSECSPKETDASIDTQASVSVANEHVQTKSSTIHHQPIPLPDSSHLFQFKNASADTSDTIYHSEDKSDKSLTVSSPQTPAAHCANIQAKSSSDTDDQTLTYTDSSCQEYSTNDQTITVSASIDTSSLTSIDNDPHQILLRCNDKLIKALSLDPQDIAEVLLAKGLIPESTEAQMRQCSSPREKATILVTTVRQRIEIAPKRFYEFLDILSKQEWTQDILEILQSYSSTPLKRDVHLQLRNTNDLSLSRSKSAAKAVSGGSEYTVSPSSKEYTFPTLNPDDAAELEAQLITSAENMKKKFAALLWKTIESFKHQVISPQTLINGVLAVTEYEDPLVGKPLLEREKEALAKAHSIDAIFNILRPHMTFFNYEVLEFLIETIGSSEDKHMLQQYLHDFQCFCRRSVFEVPKSIFGHSSEKVVQQQYFHVKITKTFKAAFLSECTSESESSLKKICAPDLGISLENAKHIQRKIALLLKLKISSLYLDSVSAGSTILTFLIPSHISLAGLDSDPDIIALASNGIHILCGPPGKPEPKQLTSKGLVVQWSQPEYGNFSLAKYILYYQKKCSETKPLNEWQKLELSSLETQTCVPDLSGDMYVFKMCTVSDVGTLQCSDESDPIVVSADGMLRKKVVSADGTLRKNVHKVIVANKDVLNLTFLSANPNTTTIMLSTEGAISREDERQISLASTLSEKAVVLVSAIARSASEKQNFLDALSKAKISLTGYVMEVLWSDYYDTVYQLYLDYLKCLYESLDNMQTSSDQWPPSATEKFFRLAMIKNATVQRGKIEDRFVQMTITGKVDDILQLKYPIQIENIFKQARGENKVILLEGAPGCGKSTLSVYICQQWEKGELFDQFELVILIRLRDPAIRNANNLVDLLPCPDTTTAQQIAARMLAKQCRDVLFILDGWDEY